MNPRRTFCVRVSSPSSASSSLCRMRKRRTCAPPMPGSWLSERFTSSTCCAHVWYERGAESSLPGVEAHAGVMDIGDVKLPDDATYYLCGPLPFMQGVRSALIDRGVQARDIQYEVFGP